MTSPQPFLRWAGGKRQLLPTILPCLPADFDLSIHRFFEPFMGGGAVTWALACDPASTNLVPTTRKTGRPLVLNDVNPDLVVTYRVIQDDVESLIATLTALQADTSEAAYYKMRASEPTDPMDRAARFIYLNRLSFNGLWRVNSAGKNNVPYGKVARPVICDTGVLRACAGWLSHAEVRRGSFISAAADSRAGDVVYFDPPYVPLNATSFSKYTKDDFSTLDQYALAGVIRGLIERGVRVVLSNSNTELTRQVYGADLHLFAVSASRSIAASGTSRARVEEVVGVSYDPALARDPSVLACLRRLTTP